MNDELGLRERLGRLAGAVPVEPLSSAPAVARPAVRLGPALRPVRGRPWLPVALVGILVVAALGILGSGARPAYGPVIETARQGDFELTLRAEKGRYAAGEPIQITASLAYRGPNEGIDIRHAQGARDRASMTGSPLGFGIREPVIGDLRLAPTWEESCELTRLERGVPLSRPFGKSAGWASSDPRAAEYQAWTTDPELRLEPRAWHVFAVAEFSIGDCGPSEYALEAEIVITVEPAATLPTTPATTADPDSAPSASDRDGDYELTIRAGKARYAPDEPIDVSASLTYWGPEARVEIGHDDAGPIMFGARERVFGEIQLGPFSRLMCGHSTLERGRPLVEGFKKAGGFSGDHPAAASFSAFFADPLLRLPEGTWHLYAAVALGPQCGTDFPTASLEAEIVIVVSDDSVATTPPAPTPTTSVHSGTQPISDELQEGPWRLTLTSPRRQYRAGEPIEVTVWLGYWGDLPSIETYGSSSGRYWSVIRELDGVRGMGSGMFADCGPQGALVAGQPLEAPWGKGVGYAPDDPNRDFYREWLEDPVLWLPAGNWEFQVTTSFTLAAGCADPAPELTARIVITVTE